MQKFTTLFLLLFYLNAFAQIEVGHYMDSQGLPIDGYLDMSDYLNDNMVNSGLNAIGYQKGYYYDSEGHKVEGLLDFHSTKLKYKKNEDDRDVLKFDPIEVKSFIIGTDSFYSTQNFHILADELTRVFTLGFSDINGDKPHYVQHLSTFNNTDFAIYYDFKVDAINRIYLLKKKGTNEWVSPPDPSLKAKFRKFVKENFGQVPYFDHYKWKYQDLFSIITMAKYYYKYQTLDRIYFDKWWNEVEADGYYSAKVESVDSIWTISYFQDGTKINESQFLGLGPERRTGYSRWYYPSGTLRKETLYDMERPVQVQTFFPNGQLHYNYMYIYSPETRATSSKFLGIKFISVFAQDGTLIIDGTGSGVEHLDDSFNSRIINRSFKNRILTESYYMNGDTKVYQWNDGEFNISNLRSQWSKFVSDFDNVFLPAIAKNTGGIRLLRIQINKTGTYDNYKALNSLDEEFDAGMDRALNFIFSPGSKPIRFNLPKVAKSKKKQYAFEVAVPFSLSVRKFYREPIRIYRYRAMPNMMNNMNFNTNYITPPKIPGIH